MVQKENKKCQSGFAGTLFLFIFAFLSFTTRKVPVAIDGFRSPLARCRCGVSVRLGLQQASPCRCVCVKQLRFLIFFFLHACFCRSKRAAYKYAKDRGAVASRWCWLATQISELDYKIRQHTDLRKHIKDNKGVVTLEAAAFEGQLPGSSETAFTVDSDVEETAEGSAARVRALAKKTPFRKRKLVQTANLHQVSKKAGRPR